jgi:hypothetical protein
MQQGTFIPYMKKIIISAYLFTSFSYADALALSNITLKDSQYNNTTWAVDNLIDNDPTTRWMSRSQSNNLNFQLSESSASMCFNGFDLTNYGGDDRGVNQFVLLTTQNEGLSTDSGSKGWKPLIADDNPIGYIDYLSWAQGARQVSVDAEYNTTSYAAKNINDGDRSSRWLSRKSNNILHYNFDTDWDGSAGNGITINELEVTNYGIDDRSVKQFQVEITNDGSIWRKLQVPGTAAGDEEYVYTRHQDGGILGTIDSQYNATSYHAENMQDGDQNSQWLSRKGNNTIEFTFDPNSNGITGADGDTADAFDIDKINIENYGNDDRSVNQFQLSVKTLANPNWHKVNVPGAMIGETDYNFAMSHQGGTLVSIDSEYNSTSYGAKNIHDGDQNSLWLSRKSNNTLAFQFDANEDGTLTEAQDVFTLNSIYLRNYGNDDRAINEFQLAVKTNDNPNWSKINVPGATIGQANYNFAMSHQGGKLVAIDSEYNSTSYGAKNIHDGDQNTLWLSRKSNNELAFQFDADDNGTLSTVEDLFTLKSIYLVNYGNDDRSIKAFQIAVKTRSNSSWTKINVPGSAVGTPDYNFALAQQGGTLVAIDGEYNSTSYGAKNIHDGDQNNLWLSRKSNNTLDFQFDVNEDGIQGGAEDLFTLESFYLVNYGNDDRAINKFQIEVKTLANNHWTKLAVSGAGTNTPNYNFALSANGGSLSLIDSEHNSTSYGAKNIHDGDNNTRWLSRKENNTLAFSFDSDFDGVSGDAISVDTISLINYGNNDISIQTFEVDIQVAGGAWQALNTPTGGTVFTASMNSSQQNWAITSQSDVTGLRLRTLSNYGDASYTGATEFKVSGTLSGQLYTYSAAMHSNGEIFNIAEAEQPIGVTSVRLRTITNYGDPSYIGAKELKLQGRSVTESKTFLAAMHAKGETFTFDSDDVPEEVTDVKLITISNHGDPSFVGAKELKLQGPSVTETKTFIAAMHSNGESFIFDNVDIPVEVTDVKLITISNYGDPTYIGAKELKLQGPSVTETKTFTAAMQSTLESFQLDSNDIPVDVIAVKLTTINNHGDPSLIGLREFEVVGKSVTAASTFTLPMNATPFKIVLDKEDTVSGVIGARIVTIKNHGDPSLTGLAEFKLLGDPITPSYIFTAGNISTVQKFNFSPVKANVFRFHSMSNHGDPSFTGAADFALNSSFCASPIANFQFDQCAYIGSGNEVIDQLGNYSGTSHNGLGTTYDAKIEKALAITDALQHVQTRIPLPASFSISTWFKKPTDTTGNRYFILGAMADGGDLLYIDRNNSWRWGVYDGNSRTAISGKYSFNSINNEWHHLALIYSNDQTSLYIDGSFVETINLAPSGTLKFIGTSFDDVASSNPQGFRSPLDEFMVFDSALSADDVTGIYQNQLNNKNYDGSTRTQSDCPRIHHYEIGHDGSGLTCAPEPIIIKACVDSECTSESTESVSLDFNITSPAIGLVTKTTPSFTGRTSINFSHTTAETIILSIDNTSIKASNAVECTGFGTSCDMTFDDAGFRFFYGESNSEVIGHQTAGKVFTDTLKLQAVKNNNGVCEGIFAGDVGISLSQENVTPDKSFNAGLAFQTNGVNIAKYPQFSDKVELNFGNDSIAIIPVPNYLDAGKIRLHAKYTNADITIADSSQNFWVKPAQFELLAVSNGVNLAGNSSASVITHKAGENFEFTVNALNELGDLTQNYRQSDGKLQLKVSRVAPLLNGSVDGDFTYATGKSIQVAPEYVTLNSFSENVKGQSLFSGAQYDEVGIFHIDLQDTNYGNLGAINGSVKAKDINGLEGIDVGRFTPAYFKQTMKEDHKGNFDAFAYPDAVGVCAFSDWVYTGQRTSENKGAIAYGLEPKITITAYNANDKITKNYTLGQPEGFMKLAATGINIGLPTHDDIQQIVGSIADNPVAITAEMEPGLLGESLDDDGNVIAGEWLYTFSTNDHFSYNHNDTSLVAPFEAQIPFITEQITDADNVTLQLDPITNMVDESAVEKFVTAGVNIRFARMVLNNAYGPENAKLRAPLNIEVFDGESFKEHADESCLVAIVGLKKAGDKYSGNMNLWDYRLLDIGSDEIQVSHTDASISGVFVSGRQNQFIFTAPAKQGALEWEYEVPSWLKFKWDDIDTDNDDNFFDDNPTGLLSFGMYRGNDRIISWREVVN